MSPSYKDKHFFYALLVLLIWLPIPLGSNRIWGWTVVEIFSFSLLLGWIWTHSASYDYNRLKPFIPLIVCFGIVLVWIFIQQIIMPVDWLAVVAPDKADVFRTTGAFEGSISVDPNQTFIEFIKGCSYLSILFLTLVLITSERRLRQLATVMVISGVAQALYGEILVLTKTHYLLFENDRWIGITTGSFISRNHYANFLLLTLSVGIGLLITTLSSSRIKTLRNRMRDWLNALLGTKALLRIGLILMVIALVMSHSRMGNTAFFASMTICSLFALVFMKRKSRGLILLFGSMLIIDIIIVSSWFGLEKVQQRLEATNVEQETRDEVVMYGLKLVKQNPISGSGAGSFNSTFQSVQGPGINQFYYYAHNEYLQFSAEYGVIAAMALGYIVLLSFWHAQYALRKRHSSLMRGMAFASMMAIIGNLMHATVDFPLQIPANTIYFIILLAIGWMSRFNRFQPSKKTHSIKSQTATQ